MRRAWVLVAALAIGGCASEAPIEPGLPGRLAGLPIDPEPEPPTDAATTGSLWVGSRGGLFADNKARRVGDLLTVRIIESASAVKDASSSLERAGSLDASIDNLFGIEESVVASNPALTPSALIKGSLDSSFAGSGQTRRSDDLETQMTVIVEDVLRNSNLVVRGTRDITVGNERQVMSFSGIVRPTDIGPDNAVLSTLVAEVEIHYGGVGLVADRQRPGWAFWLVDWLWPM